MANTPIATADAVGCDDRIVDIASFPEGIQSASLKCEEDFLKAPTKKEPFDDENSSTRAAHHDDDIIADLPHFLEMATYEDPLDDLPVFLERAARWACSKRVVGPDGTFYLFAELPCEIRLMIWRECIPSQIHLAMERVHEACVAEQVQENHPFLEFLAGFRSGLQGILLGGRPSHRRYCNSAYHIATGQKTPVIAKVNHEARVLALQRLSKRFTLGISHRGSTDSMSPIQETPVGLDEKNDTLLINTKYLGAIAQTEDALLQTVNHRWHTKEDHLLNLMIRNKIQVAIFAAVLNGNLLSSALCQLLLNAGRVDLVVGVLRFVGMTDSEAAVTDLFGLFGEESMALVPANNLRSLHKLFLAHAAFRPQLGTEFFGTRDEARYRDFTKLAVDARFIPENNQKWDSHRPSDFDAYCEEMRGLASSAIDACATDLRAHYHSRDLGEMTPWVIKLKEALCFGTIFQPVFLVHRCQSPVLTGRMEEEEEG